MGSADPAWLPWAALFFAAWLLSIALAAGYASLAARSCGEFALCWGVAMALYAAAAWTLVRAGAED